MLIIGSMHGVVLLMASGVVLLLAVLLGQAKGLDGGEPGSEDAEDVEMGEVRVEGRQRNSKHKKSKTVKKGNGAVGLKTKSWVLKKKAQMRHKGYTSIPIDTKYTARHRKKIL